MHNVTPHVLRALLRAWRTAEDAHLRWLALQPLALLSLHGGASRRPRAILAIAASPRLARLCRTPPIGHSRREDDWLYMASPRLTIAPARLRLGTLVEEKTTGYRLAIAASRRLAEDHWLQRRIVRRPALVEQLVEGGQLFHCLR